MGWLVAIIGIIAFFFGVRLRWAGQERLHGIAYLLLVFLLGVGVAFAYTGLDRPIPWAAFLGVIVTGIAFGYVAGWLWNVRFSKTAITAGIKVASLRLVSDFRISAVLIGLLLSYLLTFYFARISIHENPPGFWLAFYASWVSGLLFFTVVGLVAGLVTLYRPERDVFLARVRILLGGITGPVVDYIADEIKKIGYAAEHTTRIITIEDYDPKIDAFKIKVVHSSSLRNILRDVTAVANGTITILPDTFDLAPTPLGQITSFRINGATQGSLPLPIDPEGLRQNWSLSVAPGSKGEVEYEHWYWYRASELHTFTLSRFTEEMNLEFHCRCRPSQRRLVLKLTTVLENTEHTLDWDGVYRLPSPLRDQPPGTQPYAFKLGVSP